VIVMVYLGGTLVVALLAVVSGVFLVRRVATGLAPVRRRRPEMTLPMIARGAAVGAPTRFFTGRAVQSRHESVTPWETMSVNVIGSLILGA
jgi:fluoride ion exporter CrcB/FEX